MCGDGICVSESMASCETKQETEYKHLVNGLSFSFHIEMHCIYDGLTATATATEASPLQSVLEKVRGVARGHAHQR